MRSLILLVIALVSSGCCTIMHGGTTQEVGISSSPSGAEIYVNDKLMGKTPGFIELERDDTHIVTIKKDGFEQGSMTITNEVSGWVWGNIIAGGFIGLAVDAISGSMYNLTPDNQTVDLKPAVSPAVSTASSVRDGGM